MVDGDNDVTIPEELRQDTVVNSAVDCLEQMHLTEGERLAYDKYWDMMSYERTLMYSKYEEGFAEGETVGEAKGIAIGEAKGIAIGEAKGIAKGKVMGRMDEKKEIAANMKRANIPAEQIAAFTQFQSTKLPNCNFQITNTAIQSVGQKKINFYVL